MTVMIFIAAVVVALSPVIIGTYFGLKTAGVLLYMVSLTAGFATGGGFASFANRFKEDSEIGATLYGADLYGALIAAFFIPGILISSGSSYVAIIIAASGIVIMATLFSGIE